MADPKIENVIGALALALTDALQRDAQAEAPEPGPAAAAITLIGHVPGLSIERLSRALSLSHSGAVRLVDRLVAEGLVARVPAPDDRRAVALELTPLGDTTCRAILSARQSSLASAIATLNSDELQQFGELAAKVLRGLVRSEDLAYRCCRLCNYTACLDCPVEAELSDGATRVRQLQ